ncbi:hypothetical protein E3P99_03301 [Wallemia hederae]|uniref:F-box domain-containing protein n=1 Tax=Wallemia hederae TaxID=1540922 RepID=A0A4T0FH18_9BASI|nr:hypothetical protein E3P99_03301 [Wallemia hederae]
MTNFHEPISASFNDPLERLPFELWEVIAGFASVVDASSAQKLSLLNRNWRVMLLEMHEPWSSVIVDRTAPRDLSCKCFSEWLILMQSRAKSRIKRVEWITDNSDESITSCLDMLHGGGDPMHAVSLKGLDGPMKTRGFKFRPPPTTSLAVFVDTPSASDYFDPDEVILLHTTGLECLQLVNTFPNLLPASCSLKHLSMHFTKTFLDIGAVQNFVADHKELVSLTIINLKQDIAANKYLELINAGTLKYAINAPNAHSVTIHD